MSSSPVLQQFILWDRMSEKVRREWRRCQVPLPPNCDEIAKSGTCDSLTRFIYQNESYTDEDDQQRRLRRRLLQQSKEEEEDEEEDDDLDDIDVDSFKCCTDNPPLWCTQSTFDRCKQTDFASLGLSRLLLCHPSQTHLSCSQGLLFHWNRTDKLPVTRNEIVVYLKEYYYALSLRYPNNFTLEEDSTSDDGSNSSSSTLTLNSSIEDYQWWITAASHSGLYSCSEILYPNTKRCCSGYYCSLGEPCMTECEIEGSYCPSCSSRVPYYDIVGCGGSSSPYTACRRGHYCPNASIKIDCPKGHFCLPGRTTARECRWFENCNETELFVPDVTILTSIMLISLMIGFLLLCFRRKICWFFQDYILSDDGIGSPVMQDILGEEKVQKIRVYFQNNNASADGGGGSGLSTRSLDGLDFDFSVAKSVIDQQNSLEPSQRGRNNEPMEFVTEIVGPDGTRYRVYGEKKSNRAKLLARANRQQRAASKKYLALTTNQSGSSSDSKRRRNSDVKSMAVVISHAHGSGIHSDGMDQLVIEDEILHHRKHHSRNHDAVTPAAASHHPHHQSGAHSTVVSELLNASLPLSEQQSPSTVDQKDEDDSDGDSSKEDDESVASRMRGRIDNNNEASDDHKYDEDEKEDDFESGSLSESEDNKGESVFSEITQQTTLDAITMGLQSPSLDINAQTPHDSPNPFQDYQNDAMYTPTEVGIMIKDRLTTALEEFTTQDTSANTAASKNSSGMVTTSNDESNNPKVVSVEGMSSSQLNRTINRPLFLCDMEYTNLSLIIKGSGISVLEPCSGVLPSGSVTAVMGPSGAGKTSFVFALCGKAASYGDIGGFVTVNGDRMEGLAFRDCMGFVPQGDVMDPNLTVWETLWYEGRLRLPAEMTDLEVSSIVARTIRDVGLAHVTHTKIGDESDRGLSGGQKKRVNIAMELVAEPSMLFLDEPTSGLDATTATELMNTLRYFADHRGGRQVYSGPTVQCLPFICGQIGRINEIRFETGYRIHQRLLPDRPPANTNPADYLMDCITFYGDELSIRWKALSDAALSEEDSMMVIRPDNHDVGMVQQVKKERVQTYTGHSDEDDTSVERTEDNDNHYDQFEFEKKEEKEKEEEQPPQLLFQVEEAELIRFNTLIKTQVFKRDKSRRKNYQKKQLDSSSSLILTKEYTKRQRLSFIKQFYLFGHRTLIIRYIHRRSDFFTELLCSCLAAFVLGGFALDVRFANIAIQMYLLCLAVTILPMMMGVRDYSMERIVYYRMASTQALNRIAYWLSKCCILFSIHGTVMPMAFLIFHFAIAQPQSWFYETWPIIIAVWMTLTSIAHFISVTLLPSNGLVLCGAIWVVLNITGGFSPTLQSLQSSELGLLYSYVNPMRYVIEALFILESGQWSDVYELQRRRTANRHGWDLSNLVWDYIGLAFITVFFQCLTLYALYTVNRTKQI